MKIEMKTTIIALGLALFFAQPAWADAPTDAPATAPAVGNTSISQTSLLKKIMNLLNGTLATSDSTTQTNTSTTATNTGTTATGVGAPADSAWVSGSGSVIAILKNIATKLAGTLAATQSGTWTVQIGNTPNTTPILTTDGADGPVTPGTVAGKSALTGGQFNTAAPTLTNGQQAATQMDAAGQIKVTGGVTQGSTTSGQLGALIQCAVTAAAPTYTTAQTNPLSCDTSGNLRITGAGGGGTSSNFAAAFPAAGTAIGAKNGANMVNLTADGSGNLNVNIAAAIAAGSALIGKVGIDQTTPGSTNAVSPIAAAVGGATPYHLAGGTAGTTNSTSIKGSAGTLYSLSAINTTATVYYLRIYDSASAPTCSSATGAQHSYPIPAATAGAGFAIPIGPVGELYANGIGFCVTGGGADNDNTNAATGVYINASFK